MPVEFENNSFRVKRELEEACIGWLYEAAESIASQAANNSRVDKGNLKNSWTYVVDESKQEGTVGSTLQNAIWEEFGTGEYAVKGDGRKGYWVYVKDDAGGVSSAAAVGKQYTLEEAKKICAILRKEGLDAHVTKGKKPNRALENAYNTLRNPIIERFKNVLGRLR